MSKEALEEWIKENGYFEKYEIKKYSGNMSKKSEFFDKERKKTFFCEGSIFKRNLKRNPNSIFSPSREEFNQAVKKSNLKKYGVDHPIKTEHIQKKIKQTNLEKYGATNIMKTKEGKEKCKDAIKEKYGVDHFSKTEEFSMKIKNAFSEKSEEEYQKINNKRKKSIKEKYGKEGLKNDLIRNKAKQTSLKNFGTENPRQSKIVDQKIRKTNIKRYGHEYAQQSRKVKEKIKRAKIEKGYYKEYQKKSLKEWAKEIGFSRTHFNKLVNDLGFEEAIKLTPQESSLETLMKNIFKELSIDKKKVVHNKKIGNYRPDFRILNNEIIIECDGLFWHSDSVIQDNRYHMEKKKFYEELEYSSLFFREDEILNKKDIVSSIIRNKLQKSKKIYARKLQIKELSKEEAKIFFEKNHLMGNGSGRTFALVSGAESICAMQVRWKKKKEKLLDISRFCTKLNNSVVGGWSRLIKHIQKVEKPNKIQTFVDKRYGSGDYLSCLGWELESNFLSFQWTNGREVFHRMKFPGNSGYEYGLAKIWDCGQAKWTFDCQR